MLLSIHQYLTLYLDSRRRNLLTIRARYFACPLFSSCSHSAGEVFVLDDGGEVDLDLGNYERFVDVELCRDNNITTGKIYQQVIEKERTGDYLGKTVQGVPPLPCSWSP